MNEAGRRWVELFEKEGWFRFGKPNPSGDMAGVAISYVGGDKTNMALTDIAEVTDDLLIFEYGYQLADGQAGRAKVWIPWENIEYVFRMQG